MTTDTSGPMSGTPFASYDPDSRSWRTSEATSLWALTLSSLTLPNWGCLRDGELYELPTPAPRTDALDSSSLPSLLKTPNAADHKHPEGRPERYHRPASASKRFDLGDQLAALLPTPTVMDVGSGYEPDEWEAWKALQKANHGNGNGHGESLTQAALSTGASTAPPLPAGSASSDAPHLIPLFPAP